MNFRRRGSLFFLETAMDTSATHSERMVVSGDLEFGVTTTDTRCTVSAVTFVDGDESQGAGGIR